MARYVEIMTARELEIARLVEILSEKSNCFEDPKVILIGGYGLRAFIPFIRSTRDCDFALKKENGWHLDEIKKWLIKEVAIDTFEKKESSGYMRCVRLIRIGGRQAGVSLDFMEGEVTGRVGQDKVRIDESFVANSLKTKVKIADKEIDVRVPRYADFFILKTVSARPSDVRDIATLVWKNGIPEGLTERIREILPYPEVFEEKLKKSVLPLLKDKRFLHSLRGMFMTTEFNEETKERIIERLSKLSI